MGTWGQKPFEGDAPLDLVGDIVHKRTGDAGIKLVEKALSPRYDFTVAVAACEIINAMRGNIKDDGKSAPDELLDWIDLKRPVVPPALVTKAKNRLQDVLSDPESLRVWVKPQMAAAWMKSAKDVLRRLRMRG